jgi:hypothetical protein
MRIFPCAAEPVCPQTVTSPSTDGHRHESVGSAVLELDNLMPLSGELSPVARLLGALLNGRPVAVTVVTDKREQQCEHGMQLYGRKSVHRAPLQSRPPIFQPRPASSPVQEVRHATQNCGCLNREARGRLA